MRKTIIAVIAIVLAVVAQAQTTAIQVLDVTRKANDYFMQKHRVPEAERSPYS